jgi:glycosyltransferase involved in cell wall biosynthesis
VKVLVCHNQYQQSGGEDRVCVLERQLLEAHGHDVLEYTVHNDSVASMSKAAVATSAVWNRSAYRAVRRLIATERPHVVHVHNTLPLLSPAVYYAAHAEGVPVVQTLHNYRLTCVNALLYRSGAVCEACLGAPVPWRGVMHGCYRNSRAASATVALTIGLHRACGTWRRQVDAYVALTQFAREKMVAAGLPRERVFVKGNFVMDDPGPGSGDRREVLFVGRLSAEKGVETLLRAWTRLGPGIPLRIVGDGPLAPEVVAAAHSGSGVTWIGRRSSAEVIELMQRAAVVVVPSDWYEAFPLVMVEAFACGTPVLASRLGAATELIADGEIGRLFPPGDADALANTVRQMFADPDRLAAMRAHVRAEFESKHTASRNYLTLMSIYAKVIGPQPDRVVGQGSHKVERLV